MAFRDICHESWHKPRAGPNVMHEDIEVTFEKLESRSRKFMFSGRLDAKTALVLTSNNHYHDNV